MKKMKPILILLSIFMLGESIQLQAQVGLLTITGDLTLTSTAIYEAEIKDLTGAGTGNDQIVVTNDATLDGTLDIILDGYTPDTNDVFEILAYSGTLSGTFSTINWPAEMVSQGWDIDYGTLTAGVVTIYGPSSALPVKLVSFSVSAENGIHVLSWETASEINNDYFVIEHSLNGFEFSELGRVEGTGSSSMLQEYSFEHEADKNGDHYYRLRQVNVDGNFQYSNIVSVTTLAEDKITFFPSPTKGKITLTETVAGIVVYNLKGKEVLRSKEVSNSFDLAALPNGIFFIKINENSVLTQKLIIIK